MIGAVYLDSGLDAATDFIRINIFNGLEKKLKEPLKDPKSLLQEIVQSHGSAAPRYEVVREEGPDHNKTFTVEVKFESKTQGEGKGKNKSEAEQEAAKNALSAISQT